MTPQGLPPGTVLGAFEVVSTLGRGGMGAVYAARNRITGDVRAVKVILPELAARPEFVGRFVREIRMAMAVEHPHLVRVFEPAMHGDLIFLPMELLQGESLAAFLRRQPSVSIQACDDLIQAIGSAVVALHARGILHRDIKPSNIFLAQDRGIAVPKLLDLGAGKDVEGNEENTSTGLAVGSPHYMAPEQAAGRKDLDGRVDQYALGTLAYQLLTGARPYENDDTGHVLAKVLSGAPFKTLRELRGTIPPELEAVVLAAMSRNREERYPTLHDFLRAFHAAALATKPASPQTSATQSATVRTSMGPDPSGTVHTGVQPAARSSLVGAGVGIAGGIVTVMVGFFVFRAMGVHTGPVPPQPAPTVAAAPPAPSPAPTPAPVPSAPPATAATQAPVAAATAPATASAEPPPVPADEIDPGPAKAAAASSAPAAAHAPAPTPEANAVPGSGTTPVPTPAPTTTATARPKPRPASNPSGPEPCRPTPGSPCL